MLEPLASSVLNTVLSTRPFAAHASTSRSALSILLGATRSSFPHDFFTPRPRGTKGKEREVASEPPEFHVPRRNGVRNVDDEGAVRTEATAMNSLPTRPVATSRRPHSRTLRRAMPKYTPGPYRIPLRTATSPGGSVLQRRHASTAPAPPRAPAPRLFAGEMQPGDYLREFVLTLDRNILSEDVLESAWKAYERIPVDGKDQLSIPELMSFCNKISRSTRRPLVGSPQAYWDLWGRRLLVLVQRLDGRIPPSNLDWYRQTWLCHRARALAMTGEIDEAIQLMGVIKNVPYEWRHRPFVLRTYDAVIQCIQHFRSSDAVVEFVLDNWSFLDSFLTRTTAVRHAPVVFDDIVAFQKAVYHAFMCVENPVAFLQRVELEWERDRLQHTGAVFIDALCSMDLPYDSVAVLEEMSRMDLLVPWAQQLSIVKALSKAQVFHQANEIFLRITEGVIDSTFDRILYQTGVALFAQQGDVERVQEYMAKLRDRGGIGGGEVTQLIHLYAVRGEPALAVKVFEDYFVAPGHGSAIRADITHYTSVIHAFSNVGDHGGINTWLEKMVAAGYVPDKYVYNIILQCFARRGEVSSVAAILDQMRGSGVPPSDITYTSVIAMLAKRKDPRAAEVIYKKAISEGIAPSRTMITALMNAHVEAGSWEGVIAAFDYLKSVARARGIGLAIDAYNGLLKAYVLAGAPFPTVHSFFEKLKAMRVKPDKYTYSLVIQSACDAGKMDAAMDLFQEMERKAERWQTGIQINVYVLTIIMAGYLRQGQKARAKAIYDQIGLRGIQPSAQTFHHIMCAYSNPRSLPSIAIAEDFLKAVTSSSADAQTSSSTARSVQATKEHLYTPLLAAFTARGQTKDVERLLQDLFDSGGTPTIDNLTILLDMYRRKQNVEAVKQIWPQIHQLALQDADADAVFVDGESRTKGRLFANRLQPALSIYIDALSVAGQHVEIPLVWRQLANEGFTFDSHNWNHLVVALVRAGEIERAFGVIERVIIPYRQLYRRISVERAELPSSPLAEDLEQRESATKGEPLQAMPPPSRGARRLETAAAIANASKGSAAIVNLDDFTHPLEVLDEGLPMWNDWRPHGVVLVLLHRVMKHLEAGHKVRPLGADRVPETEGHQATTAEELEERLEESKPERVLARIRENCPQTVAIVAAYREFSEVLREERRRRGQEEARLRRKHTQCRRDDTTSNTS